MTDILIVAHGQPGDPEPQQAAVEALAAAVAPHLPQALVRGATLAKANGWSRAQASRYLTTLAERGWLKNVGTETRPVYIIGHKAVGLVPEVRF